MTFKTHLNSSSILGPWENCMAFPEDVCLDRGAFSTKGLPKLLRERNKGRPLFHCDKNIFSQTYERTVTLLLGALGKCSGILL